MNNTFWFRLKVWIQGLGSGFSQFWQVVLAGPRYLIFGGVAPDPDETISSVTGRLAPTGRRWAVVAEWLIDRVMWPLNGFRLGHCRVAARAFILSRQNA